MGFLFLFPPGLFPSHLNSKARKMLQKQRLEHMCIIIKQVVLLPFHMRIPGSELTHRNAHECGVFQNKQANIGK